VSACVHVCLPSIAGIEKGEAAHNEAFIMAYAVEAAPATIDGWAQMSKVPFHYNTHSYPHTNARAHTHPRARACPPFFLLCCVGV
jgi:hypothetical protein